MNKKLLIVIGIVFLIVGIGAYFLMSGRSSSTTPTSQDTTTSESSAQKSLRDLISLGQSQECFFSAGEENSGTFYIASGKMRGDFSSTVEGETTISHMLIEDQTSYVWVEGQGMGYKFTYDESVETETETTTQQDVDLDEKADYTCKPWVVDSSMFTLPENIEFKDMSELTSPSGTQDSKAAQCAACDSAPEDAQAQCRATLGCD